MSPYPAQVDHDRIVDKARELIEAEGFEALTLARLAATLGIKAPSLYKHVASKAALLKAVNTITAQRLSDAMHTHTIGISPHERLIHTMQGYRAFALANPICYGLLYSNLAPDSRPDEPLMESIALPFQALIAIIAGPEHALEALRGALALIHGFVTLELNEQFRRGGNIEAAFRQSIEAYLEGWQHKTP